MHDPPLDLDAVPVEAFSLIGEGGLHAVLRYTGPDVAWQRKVIRLRKRRLTDSDNGQADAHGLDLAFHEAVVGPLLFPGTVCPVLCQVEIPRGLLSGLAEHIEPHRLASRRAQTSIDLSSRRAIVMEDLTAPLAGVSGSTIAVEIKPKWGFLPRAALLSSASKWIKTRHCRFCLHEYMRATAEGRARTAYCPLDLFSGEPLREKKALDALYTAWRDSPEPGNQLRLFLDGKKVEPRQHTELEARWRSLGGEEVVTEDSFLATLLLPALRKSPILYRLQSLQRQFDPWDIEGLQEISVDQSGGGLPELSSTPLTVEELASVARKMLRGEDWSTRREAAVAYSLSASLKDCSLFIRIAKDGHDADAYDFKVVDVDLKPISKLSYWAALDARIWQNAREGIGRPPCRDTNQAPEV